MKTCGVVGYNVEDFSVLNPTILLCCIVGCSTSHKILLRCRIGITEEKLLRCGIQRKKIS
jgi:hypothetical protein